MFVVCGLLFVVFCYFGMGVSIAIKGVCVAKHFHVFWHGVSLAIRGVCVAKL